MASVQRFDGLGVGASGTITRMTASATPGLQDNPLIGIRRT
jgi:hypothetical protein